MTSTGEATTRAARWADAPIRLALEKKFAGTFPADRFEDLVSAIRAVTGAS